MTARPAYRLPEPDPRPGTYYVTARDDGRTAWLMGPFAYHSDALRMVPTCNDLLFKHYERQAAFVAIGTAHIEGRTPKTVFPMARA